MFMKKKLYMDELESFIAESADGVRMYPSDRVWLNIDKRLRGERKWPALTFGAVLTGAILLAGLIFPWFTSEWRKISSQIFVKYSDHKIDLVSSTGN